MGTGELVSIELAYIIGSERNTTQDLLASQGGKKWEKQPNYNCERTSGLVRKVQWFQGHMEWNMHGLDKSI